MQNRYRAPYAFNVLQNLFFTVLSGPGAARRRHPRRAAHQAARHRLRLDGQGGLIYAFLNFFPFQVSAVFTMSTMMESFMSTPSA